MIAPDTPTHEALKPCPFCGAGTTEIAPNGRVWTGMKWGEPCSVSVRHWCEPVDGQPSRMIERVGRDEASAIEAWNRRAALAAADAALSVQAEPVATVTECEACFTPDVCQLRGTCDHYAAERLRVAATPQPPAPVPAVPPGWAFYTADFSMKAHATAPVGHAMLVRTGDDYRAWFTLSDEDRGRIPLYVQGAGPTIQEAIAEACKTALSAHNITGVPDHG